MILFTSSVLVAVSLCRFRVQARARFRAVRCSAAEPPPLGPASVSWVILVMMELSELRQCSSFSIILTCLISTGAAGPVSVTAEGRSPGHGPRGGMSSRLLAGGERGPCSCCNVLAWDSPMSGPRTGDWDPPLSWTRTGESVCLLSLC